MWCCATDVRSILVELCRLAASPSGRRSRISRIPDFSVQLIRFEAMHAAALRPFAQACACLMVDAAEMGLWGTFSLPGGKNQNRDHCFQGTTESVAAFQRQYKINSRMQPFSCVALSMKSSGSVPYLKAETMSVIHVCSSLKTKLLKLLRPHAGDPFVQAMNVLAWSTSSIFDIVRGNCVSCQMTQFEH